MADFHLTRLPMPKVPPSVCRSLLVGLACLLASPGAFAYIDPNAGGMLFQLLAPVIAAVVGAWMVARRWLVDAVKRLLRRKNPQDPQ
ncbi:hypothetical protein QRD43_13280 [Pelomonas sp. APW6]|uniref:Uncharacterized protein n=1 Tax=Roseateles subflavus TaxID=3053353 RepID=A0ABT7LJ47_9BURK|nr:hypothetical protein [Pelomonas sp. APW6]MDL5032881.1 hypothetical protein [Pelomonas sp. APW6]